MGVASGTRGGLLLGLHLLDCAAHDFSHGCPRRATLRDSLFGPGRPAERQLHLPMDDNYIAPSMRLGDPG
jgi:hypothetical protein